MSGRLVWGALARLVGRGAVRRAGDEELSLQLAQRQAGREHVGAARLAATQQPGSGLPGG